MASSLSALSIFMKEFVKLNVYMNTIMKNVKLSELNKKIVTTLLNIKTLIIMIYKQTNV